MPADAMPVVRHPLRDWLEATLVASFLGLTRRLPTRLGMAFLRALGRAGCALAVGRRRHAAACVERALGLPRRDPRARAIVRASFENLALNLVEPLYLLRALGSEPLERLVTVEGDEHLQAALATGRGVLLATAHFGAWESTGPILRDRVGSFWAVARALDNPRLERRAEALRSRWVEGMIDKDGGGLQLARLVRGGGRVYLLLDQNAGQKGVILDFLGRPSFHHKVPGAMAARFGALVVPLYMYREPGLLRFRLVIEPALAADPNLPPDEAETDVVARVSASLAARVRASPEQWFWLHDRWRRAERFQVEGPVEHPLPEEAKGLRRRLAKSTNRA